MRRCLAGSLSLHFTSVHGGIRLCSTYWAGSHGGGERVNSSHPSGFWRQNTTSGAQLVGHATGNKSLQSLDNGAYLLKEDGRGANRVAGFLTGARLKLESFCPDAKGVRAAGVSPAQGLDMRRAILAVGRCLVTTASNWPSAEGTVASKKSQDTVCRRRRTRLPKTDEGGNGLGFHQCHGGQVRPTFS